MSVLKSKRSTSKAEYVNLANEIYTETVAFLTRLSARYARLLAEPVAALNPQGCFTKPDGKSVPPAEATKKLDDMSQSLGEKIDRENELIRAVLESDRKRK